MAATPNWNDRTKWERHDDLNVFMEHSRTVTDKKGNSKTIKFTRKDLEEIVKNNNERDRLGNPCPLTLGHTEDDKSEKDQPPMVGYARRFKLAYDEDRKKYVVRASFYLKKDDADEAKEYPRPSVEVWEKAKFFDPIALLGARTPQLDLGQWTYAVSGDIKVRYAMDDFGEDDREDDKDMPPRRETDDETDDTGDDPAATGPEDVDPEFHGQFMKCMAHHEKMGKSKKSMGDGGSLPSATNVSAPPGKPRRDEDEEHRPYSKTRRTPEEMRMDQIEKYFSTKFNHLESSIKNLREERDDFAIKSQKSELRDELRERLPDRMYNADVEVDILLPMSPKQRDERYRYLKATLAYDPAGGHDAPIRNSKPTLSRSKDGDRVNVRGGSEGGDDYGSDGFGEAELDKAQQYLHQHPGRPYEEAVQYARGERSLTGDVTERNGKARR